MQEATGLWYKTSSKRNVVIVQIMRTKPPYLQHHHGISGIISYYSDKVTYRSNALVVPKRNELSGVTPKF